MNQRLKRAIEAVEKLEGEPFKTLSAKELMDRNTDLEEYRELKRGLRHWEVVRSNLTLRHQVTGYEVDLERMETPQAVLDWICQVSNKAWISKEGLGEFVLLVDFFAKPQESMVSGSL
jgi:hypothetical protein